MAKKCPPGKYYCFTDKKCKKIPRGYRIGARGYLARGDNRSDSGGDDGSGNGSSNGNGNGGNGAGNGNGGSGGNGGGNGGGGMGESIIYEKSNPRIPRKAGQPAKSKKHSDLYTDEDPKGTIHGLGFKNVAKARASVSKIRNSSRSHAHKIQAAVAMEQRAREMGKTSEAAVYRKYINSMKKKTKRMNEAVSAAQQAAIAIDMKKKGKKPKNMKEGMYNHTDVGLITNAVVELEDGLKTLKTITYDSVDQLMQGIAKRNDISPTLLHNQFKAKHLTIPDDWAIRYRMNKMKGIEEAKKMTKKQIKKRDEIADAISTREMNKRYGDKNVKYAIATKLAMKEEETDKYNVSEEGLRDWFGKSSGTTKSGRKVRGWVQVGGKYDGKPCARQPGQKSTPKCVSSSKRRSMSKKERDSAARRKRAADPNQPQKSGAAKPTNVSTDPKRKMKENYFREGIEDIIARLEKKRISKGGDPNESPLGKKVGQEMKKQQNKQRKDAGLNPDGTKIQDSYVLEAKDKKGKGSGTKDACYHKVKSRYSVWPSAYASGALVKCRKVGAANWGNKTKKEGFSPMQVAALEAAGMIELNEAGKKCWKGYKKAGTQKLFGKTYNRCVKAGDELNHDGQQINEIQDPSDTFNLKGKRPEPKQVKGLSQGVRDPKTNLIKKTDVKGSDQPPMKPVKLESYAKVTEGVAFLKREKKKSSSKYLTQRDAGKLAKRKMAEKDQKKVNFLPPEETNESKTRLVKNGHTYKVVLTWRGKTYMVQMFVPSVSRPTRQQVEKEVQKIYPDAKLMSFLPRDLEPGEPTVMMGEAKEPTLPTFGGLTPKDADSSFIKPNSQKRKVTMRDKMKEIKNDPKGNKAKQDAMRDMNINDEYLNELDIGSEGLVQRAFDKAKQNFQNAKTDSERGKAEAHKKSFAAYASKKRRGMVQKIEKSLEKPDAYGAGEKRKDNIEKIKKSFQKDDAVKEERKEDPEGKKYSDVEKEKYNEKLKKASEKAPVPTNKIVPLIKDEFVVEDDMKGMSVKSGHKRPTKAGAGMTKKGVEAYRRRNPGSKLKTAVTTKPSKLKKGSKAANRRKSYCARSAGQMKKFPKAAKDPNSRLRQARRRWNC